MEKRDEGWRRWMRDEGLRRGKRYGETGSGKRDEGWRRGMRDGEEG